MAAMSVIGIDFGNESCYVAVAKAGGIETIANDYSLRGTPSCVAFSSKNRVLGVAAKNQMVTNMKNTVVGFKRLLGKRFQDPQVQKELRGAFLSEQRPDGGIGIQVNYLGEEHVFTPEQITAMLFTKLKEISANALQTQVNDCVISVPSYFTNSERKALLDAASIAGLNVLRLLNETTATALAYGIYKQDLPEQEQKPRNVIFVDCGHSSLQVAACAFHKGKLKILASAADVNCGGRDIDSILAEHFCKEFFTKYKMNTKNNQRAYLRLLQEVEKLKKQMSANSTKLPLNIECFIDEKDVTGDMQRGDMEQLCADLFHRVERVLKSCLAKSKLHLDDIHSVEIVGGSSRIPAIKNLIENVFGKSPSTTLNQDEAVARGAALQCAILSPAVRVRDFSVTDIQPYAVRLSWDASLDEDGDMEMFPANHPAPFSKLLTFYRREPFSVRVYYSDDDPFENSLIGQWTIKDIRPSPEGESQKVKLKVRVNIHGIITVASAVLTEKKDDKENAENGEAEAMDGVEAGEEWEAKEKEREREAKERERGEERSEEADGEVSGAPSWTQRVGSWFSSDKSKNKRQTVKHIDLPIEARTHGFSSQDLNNYMEMEGKMQAGDRQEKERADARNALEEYVYELRGRIAEGEALHVFVAGPERDALQARLDSLENWLYEDGEDCNRQTYQDKLTELRTDGEPIKARRLEWELRPGTLEDFSHGIQLANKFINLYEAGEARVAHVPEAEVARVREAAAAAAGWLETARTALQACPPHQPPPYTVHHIRQEKQNFENIVNPIMNKPKPKPKEKSPPPASNSNPNANANPNASPNANANQHGEPNPAPDAPRPEQQSGEHMDVE